MMGTIIRSTMRLLFRNKGFWFFILITPLLSTLVLSTHTSSLSTYKLTDDTKIIELDKESKKVAYHGGKGKYVVKVYDASESVLSEYMLNKITQSGIVLVCRAKTPQMTKAEADKRVKIDGFEDRMRLTNLSDARYFSGKLISGGIVSFMMTVIMGGCTFILDSERFGISRLSFIIMIFLLGLIFSTISLMIGILLGNAMSANIAAFTLWSMSSMLAGLYFPLDSTTDAVKTLSYMMPQSFRRESLR